MPPPLLFDLVGIDLSRVLLTREQIYELLPHRFEFMLLDGVCHLDRETRQVVAFVDVRPDAWWCRGHVPGRPILPGVLMLEMAGQTSAILAKLCGKYEAFIGYGGVEGCKFREAVVPPARLYFLTVGLDHRTRRITSAAQGVLNGKLVFEATTIGVTIP